MTTLIWRILRSLQSGKELTPAVVERLDRLASDRQAPVKKK